MRDAVAQDISSYHLHASQKFACRGSGSGFSFSCTYSSSGKCYTWNENGKSRGYGMKPVLLERCWVIAFYVGTLPSHFPSALTNQTGLGGKTRDVEKVSFGNGDRDIFTSATSSLHWRRFWKQQREVRIDITLKTGRHSYLTKENKMLANEQNLEKNRSPYIFTASSMLSLALRYSGPKKSVYLPYLPSATYAAG